MGIWLIYHRIALSNRTRYLDWFEEQHIQEKLDRPGYDWAAHYEVMTEGTAEVSESAFIALFGAETTRVFYDPSPAQIKPHQDDLTREMIGYRQTPLSLILTQEWQQSSPKKTTAPRGIFSPFIRLGIFAASAEDQTVAAWCAQEHFLSTAKVESHVATGKYLSSSASPRHIVLEEYGVSGSETPDLTGSDQSWLSIEQELLFAQPALAELRRFKESN